MRNFFFFFFKKKEEQNIVHESVTSFSWRKITRNLERTSYNKIKTHDWTFRGL